MIKIPPSVAKLKKPHKDLTQRDMDPWPVVIGVFSYGLALAAYFLVRSGGHWLDSDTSVMTVAAQQVLEQGDAVRAQSYAHGYGFQALVVFLSHLSGLSLDVLNTLLNPFLVAAPSPLAFLLFRELTGQVAMGLVGVVFLYLQPEFLFVTIRGSHERFSLALVMLCLLFLARSFHLRDRPGLFAVHVSLFYLGAFSLIATNSTFGSSFIGALILSLVGGWASLRWRGGLLRTVFPGVSRLMYVCASCFALLYVFVFYLYPISGHNLTGILSTAADRVAALFLNFESRENPYYYPFTVGWRSPWVWPVLMAFNWTVLGFSGVAWLYGVWQYFVRRKEPQRLSHWLLWLLYGAFAFQGAVAVLVDLARVLSSNMQVRLFPWFMLTAIPIATLGIYDILSISRIRGRAWGAVRLVGMILVGFFALLGIFKATNEPLVSNKWGFYLPNEEVALSWTEANLRYASIWTDFDERLRNLAYFRFGDSSNNTYDAFTPPAEDRYFFVSEVVRMRSARLNSPLPEVDGQLRIYDNGGTQLYHLRPRTPYQQ